MVDGITIQSAPLKSRQNRRYLMKTKLENIDKQVKDVFNKLPTNFWDFKNSDTKELTHSIHNYPAVMVYPISRNILSRMLELQNIETLMDPFMGSGTVILEGLLAGCKTIYGNDLNPLAYKISKAKTNILSSDINTEANMLEQRINERYSQYSEVLNEVTQYVTDSGYDITSKTQDKNNWGANAPEILNSFLRKKGISLQIKEIQNLGFWFLPKCILELKIIQECISEISDEDIKEYFMIAFSEVTRLVSNRRNGEFKMYRMPSEKVRTYNPDVRKVFIDTLKANVKKMNSLRSKMNDKAFGNVILSLDDSRILSQVPDNSVDIVVTSPPYGDSRTTVAYGQFSRVSLQWCSFDSLSYKEIVDIDRNLMGGTKFNKGFENNLCSPVLNHALEKICVNEDSLERAGDVYSFYKDLHDVLQTVAKKCKTNSYQFWVVGNRTVKGVNLKTDEILVEIAKNIGLHHVTTIERTISNKVMPSLNSPTNKPGEKIKTMSEEFIVILRKE